MGIINFNQIGSISDSSPAFRPTSIQFGPDGRLYATELTGAVNAFTVEKNQAGDYVVIDHEELVLPGGAGVVQSIQNHDDDGTVNNLETNRLVTGMVVAGTATNPVLYISSADPRRSFGPDVNLDTNSGVITRVTWTGTEWSTVDIVRGLPRSEESHSINGLELSADGSKLYVNVGGNTNNGAPSGTFSNTAEYALTASILEIDLNDINGRAVLTDPNGGQNNTARQYIYDLPTLDDPNVANDGIIEDAQGLDVAGPWGGNDGLNQSILPADAPLRIFADGLRNNYDLVRTSNGFYTIDNGSNTNKGGDPVDANGITTGTSGAGEATNTIVEAGPGDDEPVFLVEDGGYYGHANPTRANQNQSWTVYDDAGNPDTSLSVHTVADISALVPNAINIQSGYLIDPSKFTADPVRLEQSGIRVQRKNSGSNPDVNPLVNLGGGFASTNGVVEYTGDAFDGALQGALIAVDLSGSVTLLKLNSTGTALEPLVDPGADGLLNTADDEVLATDGVYGLLNGISTALDITEGPDGTLWIASLFGGEIQVYQPSNVQTGPDPDFDNDGIDNISDPFIRDANNGRDVVLTPGESIIWDFDEDLDGNLQGPGGYAAGLTGVLVNGSTDYEQTLNLGNVKFITASGGGTTVIENVANGDPLANGNDGEFLFHTGLTVDPTVEKFTVKWSVINPAGDPGSTFTGPSQQIGGYLGTGDQSNYLKIVATQDSGGEIQVLLENDDVVVASSFIQANDLFSNIALEQKIFFEVEIDKAANTATPTITYETISGPVTVTGSAIDLTGTNVLDVIEGNYTAVGDTAPSGLAIGIFSTNSGQPEANTFPATFNDIEVIADSLPPFFSVDDIVVDEDAGTATFTVSLSEALTSTATVDFSTVDGSALAGSDYTATNGTLTFGPGVLTQTITVNLTDDTEIEGDQTFDLQLNNPSNAVIADGIATATIKDDDTNVLYRVNVGGGEVAAPDGDLAWSADTAATPSQYLISGGDKFFSSTKTVDLSDPNLSPGALDQAIFQTVRHDGMSLPNMEWAFDVDPGANVEVRLYFAEWWGQGNAGDRSFDVAVEGTVPVTFDDIDIIALAGGKKIATVLSETVTVTDGTLNLEFLHDIQANPWLSGIEIVDAGEAPPVLSVSDITVAEDAGTATFTVSLSKASTTPVSIEYSTTEDSATEGVDYLGTLGSLTFAPGELSKDVTVTIIDDGVFEGDETFSFNLTNLVGDASIFDVSGTATILDNETPLPSLSIDDVIVDETAGTATFNVTLSEASTQNLSVDYATADGTATASTDYTATSGTLNFAAGVTSQIITVDITDDGDTEGNETFEVNLSNVSGDAILSDSSGLGTITDNDVTDSSVLYRINVGGDTVAASDGDIAWSADTALNPSLYLTSGGNKLFSSTKTVDLSNPNLPDGALVQSIFQTVRHDSKAPPNMQWAFDVDPGATVEVRLLMAEWWGQGNIGDRSFDVAVEGSVLPTFNDIDIVALAGGKKIATVLSETVTVTDGTLNLEFLHDIKANPWLSGIEIVELGEAPPEISIGDITVNEADGTATFDVTLSEALTQSVSVDYSTNDGTATTGTDFAAASGTLNFAAGITSQTITVNILDDSDLENNETFDVSLSNAQGAAIKDGIGTGTIIDDEIPLLPTLSIDDVAADETAGTATFTVSLSSMTSSSVTVDFATADGTAQNETSAFKRNDYMSNSGSITFNPGETSQTITVNLVDDIAIEGNEDFVVNLTNPTGATLADSTGVGTIVENDGTQLSESLITYDFAGVGQAASFNILPTQGDTLINVTATASEEGVVKDVFRSNKGLGVAGELDGSFNDEIDGRGPSGANDGSGGIEALVLTFDAPVTLETVTFKSSNSEDDYIILASSNPLVSGVSATSPKFLPLDVTSANGQGTEFTFTVASTTGSDDYALKRIQVSAI